MSGSKRHISVTPTPVLHPWYPIAFCHSEAVLIRKAVSAGAECRAAGRQTHEASHCVFIHLFTDSGTVQCLTHLKPCDHFKVIQDIEAALSVQLKTWERTPVLPQGV